MGIEGGNSYVLLLGVGGGNSFVWLLGIDGGKCYVWVLGIVVKCNMVIWILICWR